MITLTGKLICATADDSALVAHNVPTHIALSRAETGCLSFNVTQSADPLIWDVAETFTDRTAFDGHQTRTKASDWYRQTAHIPRTYQISES